MGKDSNFTGQPVYNQVLNLLNREKIMQISLETKGCEAYVKRFDGYQHLVVMLFGILKHFDSLRELEIGMKAEAHKLHHLGLDYLVRRSTLAEANIRRPQEFFAKVYAYLLDRYAKFLADSRPPKSYKGQTHEPKDWEKLLYMMDSTTISLLDNILKGVGRHPKSGKKKGGMKVHTVMKYHVGVPMVVQLTSAAKHDHYLLKEVHLPKESTLAIDRAYIDIAQFERLTEEGVCYVTKMKKNLKYEVIESVTYVSPNGLVTHIAQRPENDLDDSGQNNNRNAVIMNKAEQEWHRECAHARAMDAELSPSDRERMVYQHNNPMKGFGLSLGMNTTLGGYYSIW